MRNSCMPSCCFSAPNCGHHVRFCENVYEKFVNFEMIFLYKPYAITVSCLSMLLPRAGFVSGGTLSFPSGLSPNHSPGISPTGSPHMFRRNPNSSMAPPHRQATIPQKQGAAAIHQVKWCNSSEELL